MSYEYPDGTKKKAPRKQHVPKQPDLPDGAAQVSRIPVYRPGHWVKIKHIPHHRLSERTVQVSQLIGSLAAGERYVVWRLTFRGWPGEVLHWKEVERHALWSEVHAAVEAQKEHADV